MRSSSLSCSSSSSGSSHAKRALLSAGVAAAAAAEAGEALDIFSVPRKVRSWRRYSADRPLAKSLSPVRSKDVHPAVINSPQWSVKGLFAIVSYTGPMPQTREIIFEFPPVGGYVTVYDIGHRSE